MLNKELQLKAANAGTGEMSAELEQVARTAFIEKLTEVLAMRRGGKFDANSVERRVDPIGPRDC